MILLCSVFIAIGIWGLKTGEIPALISWLSIGFFGLGYPVGLFHLFDSRPQIIINETGIFDRTTHKDFINWEIIKDAYPIDIHRQKFICLIVDENFRPSKEKNKERQYMEALNEAIGMQELNLSLGQIKIDAEKLTKFIVRMSASDKPNKEELLKTRYRNGVPPKPAPKNH